MQAGTVTVAGVAESIVDEEVTILGNTITLRSRQGTGQLGTLTTTTSALYAAATTSFVPLVLPVDWVP